MVETSFQGTPEWYGGKTGILKDLVERAEAQSRQRYEPYEKNGRPLARISPFTPLQKTGFNLAEQEATNPLYSRLYRQAAQNIGGAGGARVAPEIEPYLRQGTEAVQPYNDVQNYMNPYQDQIVNQIATLGNRNLQENVLPRVNQQFIGAGQYGATGHQNLMNRALRDNQEAISQAQGQALHGGYNTALQTSLAAQTGQRERALGAGELSGRTMGRDIERQLAGGEALSSLANQQQQAGLRGAATIGQLGAQQQQQGQNELNTAYQQFQEERAFPQQQVGRLNEIIRGLPVNTSGYSQGITPQAPQASPWSQGAGLLAGATGLLNQRPQGYATGGHVKNASQNYRHYAEGGNISPIQQGANHAIDTAELQELRGHAQRLQQPQSDPFWAGVTRAGFNLAANRQPGAIANLGQAANEGLNEYQGQMAAQDQRGLQSAKIMEMIDTTKRLQAERNRNHAMKQQEFGEKQRQFGLNHGVHEGNLSLAREKFEHEKKLYEEGLKGNKGKEGKKEHDKYRKSNEKALEQISKTSSQIPSIREKLHRLKELTHKLDTGPYKALLPTTTYNIPIIGEKISAGRPEDLEEFDSLTAELELLRAELMKGSQIALGTRKIIGKTKPQRSNTSQGNLQIEDDIENEINLIEEKNNFGTDVMNSGGNDVDATRAFNKYIKEKKEHEAKNNTPFTKTPQDYLKGEENLTDEYVLKDIEDLIG